MIEPPGCSNFVTVVVAVLVVVGVVLWRFFVILSVCDFSFVPKIDQPDCGLRNRN